MGAWLGLVSPCRYKNKECKILPRLARFVFGLTLRSLFVISVLYSASNDNYKKTVKLISMGA